MKRKLDKTEKARGRESSAFQAAAGRTLGGDVGDVGGRPEECTFMCFGVVCLGKKNLPRDAFSDRMLTREATVDRKCKSCVARALAAASHAGPSTADSFLCHLMG